MEEQFSRKSGVALPHLPCRVFRAMFKQYNVLSSHPSLSVGSWHCFAWFWSMLASLRQLHHVYLHKHCRQEKHMLVSIPVELPEKFVITITIVTSGAVHGKADIIERMTWMVMTSWGSPEAAEAQKDSPQRMG